MLIVGQESEKEGRAVGHPRYRDRDRRADVAIEAGHYTVLVRSDPRDIPRIITLSRATYRKVVQNLWWAAGYKIFAIPLSGENASRLAAMQRADKNIDELLEDLNGTFHRLRQNGIEEELFDVISGFEALSVERR